MKLIIAGASGLIGNAVIEKLKHEYEIIALTRNTSNISNHNDIKWVEWDTRSIEILLQLFKGDYAILNLAGENISTGRWNKTKKERILKSRVESTRAIAGAISKSGTKPQVLIQGSAIGYYDNLGGITSDEDAPKGQGFLSDVVEQWEKPVKELNDIRTCIIRTGVILSNQGGAFPPILKLYQSFLGGKIGTGKQWFSWIHLEDEVRAIEFLLKNKSCQGIYNLTAPNPVQNNEFGKTLAKLIKRPHWMPVPAFAIKLAMGEKGETLLLNGENALPEKLLKEGFEFKYRLIRRALASLLLPAE